MAASTATFSPSRPTELVSSAYGIKMKATSRTRLKQQRVVGAKAYMENSSSLVNAINKAVSSIPILGLLARLASDEGGVGNDRLAFGEFCRRVEKRCSVDGAAAFSRFNERHGKAGSPRFVLVWCWAAVTGAGLLRSDDIDSAAMRMRASYDMFYEVENFEALMDDAVKRRKGTKTPPREVPMLTRLEKALDGICICCIGKKNELSEQDVNLLSEILCTTFQSVDKEEIEALTRLRLKNNEASTLS